MTGGTSQAPAGRRRLTAGWRAPRAEGGTGDQQGGRPRVLLPGGDDWDGCVAAFLQRERLKGRRDRTIKLHTEILRITRKDLARLGLPVKPAEIGTAHLEAVLLDLMERGRSARTLNLRIQGWRQWFRFLVEAGFVAADPTDGLPRQREDYRQPKALTDSQVRQLLGQPDRASFAGLRDYVMMLILLDTGMRLGEILNLCVQNLDLEHGTINVAITKDHEERRVYVVEKTLVWIRRYMASRKDISNDILFIGRDGTRLHPKSFQAALWRYGGRIGIRVTPHLLRHTFSRMYIMGGGDPFSLQQILGHSTMDMVKQYVRLWGTDVQRLHRKFSPVNTLLN